MAFDRCSFNCIPSIKVRYSLLRPVSWRRSENARAYLHPSFDLGPFVTAWLHKVAVSHKEIHALHIHTSLLSLYIGPAFEARPLPARNPFGLSTSNEFQTLDQRLLFSSFAALAQWRIAFSTRRQVRVWQSRLTWNDVTVFLLILIHLNHQTTHLPTQTYRPWLPQHHPRRPLPTTSL